MCSLSSIVQESIESANTTIEDDDVKGRRFGLLKSLSTLRGSNSQGCGGWIPFSVSSYNFLSVFLVSPSLFALTQPMYIFIDPPTHTNSPSPHLKPTHMPPPPCESPSALRLGSLVSSFVSSKNRSSQMSDSRQTPTSSVQCKSHPRGGRVVPLSSPPAVPSIATEKEAEVWSCAPDGCF